MKKIARIFLSIAAGMLLSAAALPAAEVYLSLSAHSDRMDLGIAGFIPETQTVQEASMCRRLQDVLRADLLYSRYFNLTENGPMYTGRDEELKAWSDLGATTLICGKVRSQGDDLSLTGQVFDIGAKQVIWEKTFKGSAKDYRRLAHELNDEIVQHFVGERGIAHSKIVFANSQGKGKDLYIVDYDGENLRRLTTDGSLNLLPKWSPQGDEILFTTYRYGNPDLYALATSGGSRRAVSTRQGLNTSAVYAPDGKTIAVTLSRGATPCLYLMDRNGQIIKKLSNGSCIETSASFAPNGREIVFISDKPGYPQLYIMSVDGGNVRRIPTNGYCDSPAWSPRGDKIVFTMRQGRDNFDLYLYDLASDSVSRLTQDDRDNQNASWSPDGRFIVFTSTRSGRSELYIMAIDGSGIRKLVPLQGSSATASWSP